MSALHCMKYPFSRNKLTPKVPDGTTKYSVGRQFFHNEILHIKKDEFTLQIRPTLYDPVIFMHTNPSDFIATTDVTKWRALQDQNERKRFQFRWRPDEFKDLTRLRIVGQSVKLTQIEGNKDNNGYFESCFIHIPYDDKLVNPQQDTIFPGGNFVWAKEQTDMFMEPSYVRGPINSLDSYEFFLPHKGEKVRWLENINTNGTFGLMQFQPANTLIQHNTGIQIVIHQSNYITPEGEVVWPKFRMEMCFHIEAIPTPELGGIQTVAYDHSKDVKQLLKKFHKIKKSANKKDYLRKLLK